MEERLLALAPWFDAIDVTPEGWPGRFEFRVPNARAFRRWPAFPAAARPEAGRAAGGRGLTAGAAARSGLGEAVELASVAAWGDEPLVTAPAPALGAAAIRAEAVLGLSAGQVAEREGWNRSLAGLADWRPAAARPERAVAWLCGRDGLGGAARFLPADLALVGRRAAGEADALGVADTRGCAAGESPAAAALRAVEELVERDAAGRWWHGARRRPVLSLAALRVDPGLRAFLAGRERRTWIFDISTDLGGAVLAAASWEPDGGRVALGFAARATAAAAAVPALTEMLQTELGLAQRGAQGDPLGRLWEVTVAAGFGPLVPGPAGVPEPEGAEPTAEAALDRRLRALAAAGCPVALFDMTRPEFGVPVLRAVAPGLASDRPRWGAARLLAPDPRDLGPPPVRGADGVPPNPFPLLV